MRINEHEVRALPLLRVRYDDVRVGHHLAVMCDFYSKKSLEFFDSIVHQVSTRLLLLLLKQSVLFKQISWKEAVEVTPILYGIMLNHNVNHEKIHVYALLKFLRLITNKGNL